jgi:hypothetical protein
MKVIGTQANYADGYHAAVQQFGYSNPIVPMVGASSRTSWW